MMENGFVVQLLFHGGFFFVLQKLRKMRAADTEIRCDDHTLTVSSIAISYISINHFIIALRLVKIEKVVDVVKDGCE